MTLTLGNQSIIPYENDPWARSHGKKTDDSQVLQITKSAMDLKIIIINRMGDEINRRLISIVEKKRYVKPSLRIWIHGQCAQ